MNALLSLYCKSYRVDLNRVIRLAQSIQRFNTDGLPFYISVPTGDVPLFRQELGNLATEVIDDDLILEKNRSIDLVAVRALPGHISQQVIKSEFWRLNFSPTYMCLDSDAFFIRPFKQADFLLNDGMPYTVIDEGHEFLVEALSRGKVGAITNFYRDTGKVQALFGRQGRAYSFGPFPVLWHRLVWQSLENEYLRPKGMSLQDAIVQMPVESHWYGEALLKYLAIPVMPCQPLFKVYHYGWQLESDRRMGVGNEQLAQIYSGVIYQSSWEREMDWPSEGGNKLSWLARRLRMKLGRV